MISNAPNTLAFCTKNNKVHLFDVQSNWTTAIQGITCSSGIATNTHIKEVPGSSLLISLNQIEGRAANFELLSASEGRIKPIFTHGEIRGNVGFDSISYNPKRRLLAVISDRPKTRYHLFEISENQIDSQVPLLHRGKWHSEQNPQNKMCGMDISPDSKLIATINNAGTCLISDIDTQAYIYHKSMGTVAEYYCLCKWSLVSGSPILFARYSYNRLNMLDVEKKKVLLQNSIRLEDVSTSFTKWIDICPNDPNLVAAGGFEGYIRVFDIRTGAIVKKKELHRVVNCVRWDQAGKTLATCSDDRTVKVTDFGAEKVMAETSTGDEVKSVCFLG